MSLAREKMEADQRAALLGKEVENVKVSDKLRYLLFDEYAKVLMKSNLLMFTKDHICVIQGELMGVMRAARQEKEKVKMGMKEREEEGNLLLRKMQERLKVV